MKINTIRFGEIDIAEEKVLTFKESLAPFYDSKRFTIINPEQTDPFLWLQSLEEPDVALAVVNPYRLFPNYIPVVNEADLGKIGNPSDEDILILTVAVIPHKYENMTTNLVSPILINSINNQAMQIVMENSGYVVKQPIFNEVRKLLNGEGMEPEGGGKDAGSDA